MHRRLSLRFRFLILLVVLLLTVFITITLIIVSQNTSTLKTGLVNESKSFAALATQPIGDSFALYRNSGTIRIQQEIQRFTDLDKDINEVQIVDVNGKSLYTNNDANQIKVTSNESTSLTPSYIYNSSGVLTAIVQPYLGEFGIHNYAIVYGISYKSINNNIKTIVTFIVILSSIILLTSLTIGYIAINRLFLVPVANLSRTALLISKGDLDRQIKSGRHDEIGDLAGAVDTMANSLKADIAKLKEADRLKNEFIMITSHNLRTPLTTIKGYMEIIGSMNPPKEFKNILDVIGVNAMRLGGFAEDMLTISTIEAGQNILHPEPTDMMPVLDSISKEFGLMAEQKKLKFNSHIDAPVQVNLSKPHFRSALWNLLDNAYKFTSEGGQIDLSAHVVNDHLEISVKDSGIGIAETEVPRLFTKFHRGTDILKYNYEGTGIGLYIAKLIVEQHGGQIKVTSTQGQGSTFIISLPIITQPTSSPSTKTTA